MRLNVTVLKVLSKSPFERLLKIVFKVNLIRVIYPRVHCVKILIVSNLAFDFDPEGANSVNHRLNLLVDWLHGEGHQCQVLVRSGTVKLPYTIELPGEPHPNMWTSAKSDYLLSPESVLMRAMEYAREHQAEFEVIVCAGQEYMPYWVQPWFQTPFLLWPNLAHSIPEVDALLRQRFLERPYSIGFLTESHRRDAVGSLLNQVRPQCRAPILWAPFQISHVLPATSRPSSTDLFWAGRVDPSKGLTEVAEVARRRGLKLKLAGVLDDPQLWHHIQETWAPEYLGVLRRDRLMEEMGQTMCFLQLQGPWWKEAFGRLTAEALLAGTPVIAFDRGANTELVEHGVDGFIVKDLDEAVARFDDLHQLDRQLIQRRALDRFSTAHHGRQVLAWFEMAIKHWPKKVQSPEN